MNAESEKPHQTIFRATSKYKMRVLQSLLGTYLVLQTLTALLKGKYFNMQMLDCMQVHP